MNAREFCLKLLLKQEKSGAYSNLLLDASLQNSPFSAQDNAFVTACFYGVIEKKITLDYTLSLYLTQPLKKLRPEVLCILRLGAYQILFMDKVPHRAAIHESVQLTKSMRVSYASGLVNAVLRKVAANGLLLPETGAAEYYSVKYSVPDTLIRLWKKDYGLENTLGILASLCEHKKTAIRVNTLKTDKVSLAQALAAEGVKAEANESVRDSLYLCDCGDVTALAAFQNGLFHVEDTAAQMAALFLEPKQGERILDCCAAPGGKTFTIAEEMRSGEIIACDIHAGRVNLFQKEALRLGIDFIQALVQDACVPNPAFGQFDRVLCDVPCSGLGIIAKKPEIRYKSADEILQCSRVQSRILEQAFAYLKNGGTLVYSTCTLNKKENDEVIAGFLRRNTNASLLASKTFFPHIDKTDGFYVAKLMKDE